MFGRNTEYSKGPPAEKNYPYSTFGDTENNYVHANPSEFIRIDSDTFETSLKLAQSKNPAAFPGADFIAELAKDCLLLQTLMRNNEIAFDRWNAARKAVGDLRGTLRPYVRPNNDSLNLEMIHKDNERQHGLATGLVRYQLEVDQFEASAALLEELCDKLITSLDTVRLENLQLLIKHNILCAKNQLQESKRFVACMTRVDAQEYNRLTDWIRLQWRRYMEVRITMLNKRKRAP